MQINTAEAFSNRWGPINARAFMQTGASKIAVLLKGLCLWEHHQRTLEHS